MVETQLRKQRGTPDTFVGRAYSIFHLQYDVCELNLRYYGYHVPGPTRLRKCGNPSCQLTLGELGKLGRLSCLEPRHGPSPPYAANGSSAVDISPSGFPQRDYGKPRREVL